MLKIRQTVSGVLLVVAFLALAALASFNYSPNEEDRSRFQNSLIYQQGWMALRAVFFTSEKLADTDIAEKTGIADKVREFLLGQPAEEWSAPDEFSNSDLGETAGQAQDWLSQLPADQESLINEEGIREKVSLRKLIYIGNTETGSEIIFQPESDNSFRLRLPFHVPE